MKSPFVLAAVLLAAGQLSAQNQPVPPPAAPPTTPKTTVVAPAVVKPVDPKAVPGKPAVKKPEVVPVIPGQTIARGNGTYLGLQVVNGNFVLSFYDKKKKPMLPDVTRVTARWPNLRSATTGDNRAVLNRDGNVLVGNKSVVAPLTFNLRLALLVGDGEEAKVVESYVVPFKG